MRCVDLDGRLRALERRVQELEAPDRPPAPEGTWWLLERLGPAKPHAALSGTVAYGGVTRTPGAGDVVWQAEHEVADLLDLDTDLDAAAGVLAALGSPVRLELLRRMLHGATTLAELQAVPGLRTAGQVHHHLRELRSAGLVTAGRNHFTCVPARVVPLLVALACATGPGGAPPPP